MIYHIPKGFHYSLPRKFRTFKKDTFDWTVKFDDSCRYSIGEDQLDWNKLCGVSNYLNPRKESIRFVWRYELKSKMWEIGIYIERNNKWEVTVLGYADSQPERLTMYFLQNNVAVKLGENKVKWFDFQKKEKTYDCQPYFGGNKSAPHCMKIDIDNEDRLHLHWERNLHLITEK